VLLELLRSEAGEPELGDLLDALLGGEVGEVHGRLAALGTGELEEGPALGILLLRPAFGRRPHLAGLGGAHGWLGSHGSERRGPTWTDAAPALSAAIGAWRQGNRVCWWSLERTCWPSRWRR